MSVWTGKQDPEQGEIDCGKPAAELVGGRLDAPLAQTRGGSLSAATGNCPETATKLPGGGHEFCPLTVMGSARHDVVCLAAVRG